MDTLKRCQQSILAFTLCSLPLFANALNLETTDINASPNDSSKDAEQPTDDSLTPDEAAKTETSATTEAKEPPPLVDVSPSDYEKILKATQQDSVGAVAPRPTAGKAGARAQAAGQSVQTPSTMNPAISLIADVALAYFDTDEPLQLGAHDPNSTGFTLQQLEFHAQSKIDPYFDMQANLIFSEYGVEIEELYARTLALPYSLQIRVGQFLLPFGRINQTHPHTWSFVDQTLLIGTVFGGEGGRGLGVETSWLIPLPWYTKATLSLNENTGQCCARSYTTGGVPTIDGPEDFLYTSRLEQFVELSIDWSILFGLSYVIGENQTGDGNQTHLRGSDLFIKYKPVASANRFYTSLQIEWVARDRQVPGDNFQSHAGYAELKTGFNPYWEMATRAEWVLQLGSGQLDDSLEGERRRYAGQVTYYPSHFSRLRFQVSNDQPNWREQTIWSAMLALEVLAGAHGAHVY